MPLFCPVWPNSAFLHRVAVTSRTPLIPAGTVLAFAGVVAAVDGAPVDAVAPFVEDEVAVPHGAIVVVAHEAVSKFLIRPNSL